MKRVESMFGRSNTHIGRFDEQVFLLQFFVSLLWTVYFSSFFSSCWWLHSSASYDSMTLAVSLCVMRCCWLAAWHCLNERFTAFTIYKRNTNLQPLIFGFGTSASVATSRCMTSTTEPGRYTFCCFSHRSSFRCMINFRPVRAPFDAIYNSFATGFSSAEYSEIIWI